MPKCVLDKEMECNPDKCGAFAEGKCIPEELKKKDEEICPECGSKLEFKEGCKSCSCGWSACG